MINKIKGLLKSPHLFAGLLVLIAGICCYGAVTAEDYKEFTEMPGTLKADPLNGAWKDRIIPKYRAIISYMDKSYDIQTFRGQGESISHDLTVVGNKIPLDIANLGLSKNPENRIFAMSSCAGQILGTTTISPDFNGITKFENVPLGVVCNAYFYMNGGDNGTSMLCLEITDKDKRLVRGDINDAPSPAYKCKFLADGSWRDAPQLDQNVCTDIQGFDWNKDGYTDYVITYPHNKNKKPAGGNDKVEIAIVYVDGKTFMEHGNETDKVTHFYRCGDEFFTKNTDMVGGLTDVKPANSMRSAIGDFNGDGVKELALYHTRAKAPDSDHVDDLARDNYLYIYSIDPAKKAITKHYDTCDCAVVGKSYLQNDSVGIAAGDIDGDGRDELALISARASALYTESKVYLYVLKCNNDNLGSWSVPLSQYQIGETFDVLHLDGNNSSMPPIDAQLADLDGDGIPELAWYTVTSQKQHRTSLAVTKWSGTAGNVSLGSAPTTTSIKITDKLSWALDAVFMRYSMSCGMYDYPLTSQDTNMPKQIAITQLGNNNRLYWAILRYSSNDFTVVGLVNQDGGLSDAKQDNLRPIIMAADIDNESMVLGDPTVIDVDNNLEMYMVTQAPPKHWDSIYGRGGSFDKSCDANGNVTFDVYAVFDNPGYYTGMKIDKTYGSTKSTMHVGEGKAGVDLSIVRSQRRSLEQIFLGTNADPMLDMGLSGAIEGKDSNTDSYKSSLSYTFSYTANRDDQLFYKNNSYVVSRYPVLFPKSKRYAVTSDDQGNEIKAQHYIQFVVPNSTITTFAPSEGRSVSWYDPMYDNYNLFTYPKHLKDITGYPQGTAAKKEINKYDPWADINGKEFVTGQNTKVGNPDDHSFEMTVSQGTSHETYNSIKGYVGGHTYYNHSFGKTRNGIKLDINADGSYGTETTSTTDASQMLSVTMGWPGSYLYNARNNDFSAADMKLTSDVAYFSQDDGAICVGYAIPELKDRTSKIWDDYSPYSKYPDPGFILPMRWLNDIKYNDKGQACMIKNTTRSTRYQLRGLSIIKDDGDKAATGKSEGLALRLLEADAKYSLSLRVVNYSFKRTSDDVKVKFYFQPWTSAKYTDPLDTPTSSNCKYLGESTINTIFGRTASSVKGDNWANATLDFTTPEATTAGWFHAVIEYNGTQLNADNDHGYALVGIYQPGTIPPLDNTAAASAVTIDIASADRPDISISKVKAYEVTENKSGDNTYTPVTLSGNLRGKKLRFEVTVGFTGGKVAIGTAERDFNYLPLDYCVLLAGKNGQANALLAGDRVPLIKSGDSYTYTLDYSPDKNIDGNALYIKTFSPLLDKSEQSNASNDTVTVWGEQSSSGSTGGCDIGFGVLALLALVPVLSRRKK